VESLRVAKPDHLAVVRDRPVLPLAPEQMLLWRFAASSGCEKLAQQRHRGLGIPVARLVEGGDERSGGLDPRGQLEETPHVVPGEPLTGSSTARRPVREVVFHGRPAARIGCQGTHQRLVGAASRNAPLGDAGAEKDRGKRFALAFTKSADAGKPHAPSLIAAAC
jgi:hypothetical protein